MTPDINPTVGAMLMQARERLFKEHHLFTSLNMEPVLIGKNKVTIAIDLPEKFAGANEMAHHGLLTIVMDSILGLCVLTALDDLQPIATINLRLDFIEDIKVNSRAICEAECISVAHNVATVKADLYEKETNTHISQASGAFLIGTKASTVQGSRL